MLTPAQAETLIEQHLACLPIESLPLTQAAGAVLRENIYAERDQPPFDRVAMDGIALSAAAAANNAGRLRVAGTQAAGDPPQTLADPDDLHRDHDGRHVAARLRRRGAGRAGAAQRRLSRRSGASPCSPGRTCIAAAPTVRQGALLLSRRHAALGARSGDRRRRRHGAPASQRPTHDRGDLHRQ